MTKIELNIDVGELEAEPEALFQEAHLVHVACGGHAGSLATMRRAAQRARAAQVRLGAHPSFPDRRNFGRVPLNLPRAALTEALVEQLRTFADVARGEGVAVESVKAHGALYHVAAMSEETARTLLEAIARSFADNPIVVGPPEGPLRELAAASGFPYWPEAFADRAKGPDGSLVPRSAPGALIVDPALAAAEARRLVETGRYRTVCVHSDTPGAVAIARAVRQALDDLARKTP